MNVLIRTIPHDQQRYETVGDWTFDGAGNLTILVSNTGDWRSDMLVALHEFVEVLICKNDGVTQQQVDDFDKANLQSNDPGDLAGAPYGQQHCFAMAVERMVCAAMNLPWTEHDARVDAVAGA